MDRWKMEKLQLKVTVSMNTGFFFSVRGRHPTPVKWGKMHDKGHIWGKFSVKVV